MSSLTSWNMSIPEKGGFNTAESPSWVCLLCNRGWCFLEFFRCFFTNLTPEVKKIFFFVVIDFIKVSLF